MGHVKMTEAWGSNSVFIASCGRSLETQLGDVVGRLCSEYIGVVGAELKKFTKLDYHALNVMTLMPISK
jgi:hypothetical protein